MFVREDELLLVLLAGFLLIGVPVLAISAFVRVQSLARRLRETPTPLRSAGIEQRLAALEQRLIGLERKSAQLEPKLGPSLSPIAVESATPMRIPPTPPPRPVAPPATPAPPTPPPPISGNPELSRIPLGSPSGGIGGRAPMAGIDLETLIAGRWLNYLGILALLFAVAFFVKYAFENNWVGPRGRVAIGLLLGSAVLPWSHRLLKRGYQYFSEGIAGLGAAVLYFSLWAGWQYYQVFSQGTAFVAMIVVTAAMLTMAVGRDSQRIAALAVVGGLLTPLLVSTGHDQEVVLFTYLAVLSAGALVLARQRDWEWISPIQFAATTLYFWGWYSDFYANEKLPRTCLFATLFFLLFAALPVVRTLREGKLPTTEIFIIVANALNYLLALRQMLWPQDRWTLTLAVLALAAAHLWVLHALGQRRGGVSRIIQLLFAGLALTYVTLAIPIRLDGKWITIAWSLQGAVLIWSGLREKMLAMRGAGLFLLGVVALRLAIFPIPAPQFLFNARFTTFAVAVAAFAASVVFANRKKDEVGEAERGAYFVLGIAVNGYALAALSLELWDLFGRTQAVGIDRGLAQQLSLSILWTVYAAMLLAAGIRRHLAGLRWQALALLGLAVGKVFLFDLSFLERFYRIVSFLLLGLVLLLVSFFYQRKMAARGSEEGR